MKHGNDRSRDTPWVLLAWILLALTFGGPIWHALHPQRPAEHPRTTEDER